MNVVGGKWSLSKSRKHSAASVFYRSPTLLKYRGVAEENVAGTAPHCIRQTDALGVSYVLKGTDVSC